MSYYKRLQYDAAEMVGKNRWESQGAVSRLVLPCMHCHQQTSSVCGPCGAPYCSQNCIDADWTQHRCECCVPVEWGVDPFGEFVKVNNYWSLWNECTPTEL
jgi:hypothetical protein